MNRDYCTAGAIQNMVNIIGPTSDLTTARQQEIGALAYEFWLERGFRAGSPEEDWLRAERVVRGKVGTAKLRRTTVGNYLAE